MKTKPGCIPCIMKQAYNTAIRATSDQSHIKAILDAAADHCKTVSFDVSPADSSNFVYWKTTEITGHADPYEAEKKQYNDICMKLVPEIKKKIEYSVEPLHDAIRAAIFGNIIDLGIGMSFDIEKDIEHVFSTPLAIDDYLQFKQLLETGRKNILYLTDNAGEIVFDMLLIDELRHEHEVTAVVKSGPIINDVTMQDAEYVGLTDLVNVIETGSNGIGVQWSAVSDEFRNAFETADIILSKGQGNFETINECDGTIFFMLKAKCDFVADELAVELGEIVFKRGGTLS